MALGSIDGGCMTPQEAAWSFIAEGYERALAVQGLEPEVRARYAATSRWRRRRLFSIGLMTSPSPRTSAARSGARPRDGPRGDATMTTEQLEALLLEARGAAKLRFLEFADDSEMQEEARVVWHAADIGLGMLRDDYLPKADALQDARQMLDQHASAEYTEPWLNRAIAVPARSTGTEAMRELQSHLGSQVVVYLSGPGEQPALIVEGELASSNVLSWLDDDNDTFGGVFTVGDSGRFDLSTVDPAWIQVVRAVHAGQDIIGVMVQYTDALRLYIEFIPDHVPTTEP